MADNSIQRMAEWLRAKERGQAVQRPDLLAKAAARPKPPAAPAAPGPRVEVGDEPQRMLQPLFRPPTARTSALGLAVEAPCAVCGGPARPGVPTWGGWRVHDSCRPLLGDPTGRLQAAALALGMTEVSRADAGLLGFRVACCHEEHPEPTWTTEPTRQRMRWHWVDRKALRVAVGALPGLRAEAGLVAARCADGRCAWCGVSWSAGWWADGHSWPDGSAAPLCAGCHPVWVRHGEPSLPDEVAAALAEAITGAPSMFGDVPPTGLVPYADAAVEDPDSTQSGPWSHLDPDAVRSFRFETWARYGLAYCPPEHRAEVEAWARARDAEWAERAAQRAAAEAAAQDVHGFSFRATGGEGA